jgi:membrane associated rhomboid family serine protease
MLVLHYAISLFIFTLFWRLLSANVESGGKLTRFGVPESGAIVGAIVGILLLAVISYGGRSFLGQAEP